MILQRLFASSAGKVRNAFRIELRVRLKERRNRLYKKDHQVFENELKYFLQWMEQEPYLRLLLAEVEAADITLEKGPYPKKR